MKFAFILLTTASLVITSFAAPTANVAALISDVNTIKDGVGQLDSAVMACPATGADANELLALSKDLNNLAQDVKVAAGHAKATPGPLPDSDGKALFNVVVSAFRQSIPTAIQDFIDKKSSFDRRFYPAIRSNLTNLRAIMLAYADALIALAPPSLKSQARALRAQLQSDFDRLLAAFI